jgi:2-amino-4-hydroxy-6-hydroxymethyldihydropteridine diphosphokinase
MRKILLALGGNQAGNWGRPIDTLRQTLTRLEASGLEPVAVSPLYATAAIGGPAQAGYLNAVVRVRSNLAPAGVLRVVKRLEQQAGRRLGPRWGPRPLDIDILDDGGRRQGWSGRHRPLGRHPRRVPQGLVLPHPSLHLRAFVLVPLLAVCPSWNHPVLKRSGRQLLAATGSQRKSVRLAPDAWPTA